LVDRTNTVKEIAMRYQIYGEWMVDERTWYEMTADELRAKRLWAEQDEAKRMVKVLARRDARKRAIDFVATIIERKGR
jgi:hypothetical protein